MNAKAIHQPQTADSLLPIPHPGETLLEDFMQPLGLTYYAVAKAIGATPITVSKVCRGQRDISALLALKLARYFGTTARFWTHLQSDYDLRVAERENGLLIEQSVIPLAQAAYERSHQAARSTEPSRLVDGPACYRRQAETIFMGAFHHS